MGKRTFPVDGNEKEETAWRLGIMIGYDEILNMNYYKKTTYTGWTGGMRFLIRREEDGGEEVFHVFAWPGPYIFDLTADEKKLDGTFPFTEEGRKQVVDWLNRQLEENKNMWPGKKTGIENGGES